MNTKRRQDYRYVWPTYEASVYFRYDQGRCRTHHRGFSLRALPETLVSDTYEGKNIAKVVILILQEYKVIEKLSVFIIDNAKLNNTTINVIIYYLYPKIQPRTRRSRYLSYIINLIIKAFLFSINIKAFKVKIGTINKDLAYPNSEAIRKLRGPSVRRK